MGAAWRQAAAPQGLTPPWRRRSDAGAAASLAGRGDPTRGQAMVQEQFAAYIVAQRGTGLPD